MAYLTASELARLGRMAGEAHKALADRMISDARLDEIVGESALLRDDLDLGPQDVGYTTTVDLYRAAAAAWMEKASMVADGYDFQADGASFTRSQMFSQYLSQASRYASMANSLTVSVGRPVEDESVANAFEEWLDNGGGI